MRIACLTVGPFAENVYLLGDEETRQGYIIDPGDEVPRILLAIEKFGLQPMAMVNTHGHLDHVGGAARLQEELGIPFWLHRDDAFLLASLPEAAAAFGLPVVPAPRVDRYLSEGEELPLGRERLRVIHTPGHTPGGITLHGANVLVVGDLLFAGSVGRTDLPGGSWEALCETLRRKILVLPDETEIYPGHGPATTLGAERRTNPFLQDL